MPALLLACVAYLSVALPGSTLGLLWPSIRLSLGQPVGALGILLVPGIAELELVEVRASLRPGTPDNTPIIGEVDGIIVATGHYRNGILLTPATADAVAALVAP